MVSGEAAGNHVGGAMSLITKAYICYVKTFEPELTPECEAILSRYYQVRAARSRALTCADAAHGGCAQCGAHDDPHAGGHRASGAGARTHVFPARGGCAGCCVRHRCHGVLDAGGCAAGRHQPLALVIPC